MSRAKPFIFPFILILLVCSVYWQFFILGRIPVPADTLVGAYFPWYDYTWGYPVHVPVKNTLITDVFSQFFLWKYLAVDLLRSGELPLWNIYSFSGTPFLATYHSAVLNPFNLLLLLPKYYGWGVFIFGQSLVAALGMYVLLNRFVKNEAAKISAALIFAFSGLMSTWVEFGTGVWAAACLPWIIFSVQSFFDTGRVRYLFLMSVAFLVLFFSGHAQLTLYSSILLFLYTLFFGSLRKNILCWFFFGLAVLMGMVQFLPSYELTKTSIRATENYASTINYGLSPVYDLVKLFAADFFGNPTTENYWGLQNYQEQSSFLGSISLCFIVPFLYKRFRSKVINFWGAVFLISVFLAIDNPLTKWFYTQPLPFLTYSHAGRILFITSFSAAILSGFGIEKFFNNPDFFKLVRRAALYLSAVIFGFLLGFFISKKMLSGFIEVEGFEKLVKNYNVTFRNLILPLGMTFLLVVFSVRLMPKKVLAILIVLILLFDLGRYFTKFNPFVPQNIIFPDTPITEYLRTRPGIFRVLRLEKDLLPPNTWIAYKLQSVEGYDPLYSEDYARFFSVLNGGNYETGISRFREINRVDSRLFDTLNVKYAIKVKRNVEASPSGDFINKDVLEAGYKRVFEDKRTVVFENPKVIDRVYFVDKIRALESNEELGKILTNKNFDPTKEVLVFDGRDLPANFTKGQAEITKYTSTEVELKTKSESEGFLVFSDSFDKGWKLARDGSSERLYKVNGAFRGFLVPKGESTFRMYYYPDSFDLGLKISLGTVFILISLIIYSLKRKLF